MKRFLWTLTLLWPLLLSASGLPKEVRTYYDSIRLLSDSVELIDISPSALSVTLEVRFTIEGKGKVSAREISLLWNVVDSADYMALTLGYESDGYDTTFDKTYAVMSVKRVAGNRSEVLWTERVESPFAHADSENALAVTLSTSGHISLLFGHPLPEEIATVVVDFTPSFPLGVAATGTVKLPLVVSDVTLPAREGIAEVLWTGESIQKAFKDSTVSAASPVGEWYYLDRDTDNKRARSGGRYKVAILPSKSGEGYDIVYLAGAEVNPEVWREGMLKGRLVPTPFSGHFDLEWVDAHLNPIMEDIHATLDASNSILTLSFPLLGSTIRLYRK